MQKITVNITETKKSYNIEFLNDFTNLQKQLIDQIGDRDFLIITDENVFDKTEFFKNNHFSDEKVLILPAGEDQKRLQTIEKMWRKCGENKLDRSSVLVAVGGGVIGDMTGFTASSFKRGVDFIQVPTTLLSMVDASVGGKTGFDNEYGKNIIGAFYQPEVVFCCRDFLNTLPEIEVKNGLAEMIKHGIIDNSQHFKNLEKISTNKPTEILDKIFSLVPESVFIKKKIVEEDEKEKGIRAHLNLGHTFGHSIELLSDYQIPHGQAVAIGILMAASFSAEQGFCDEKTVDQIENIFNKFDMDLLCDYSEDEIFEKMTHDKKVQKGKTRLILPKKIGEVFIYELE